jgi:hypothetical protein
MITPRSADGIGQDMGAKALRLVLFSIGVSAALGFLAFFIGLPLIIGFEMAAAERRDCQQMTALAQDAAKVEYLRNWTEKKIADPAFLERYGKYGTGFNYPGDPGMFRMHGFDFDAVGIDPIRVGLLLVREDFENYRDPANIKAVAFSIHNAGVFISVNNSSGYGRRESGPYMRVTVVNDDVWVSCRSH